MQKCSLNNLQMIYVRKEREIIFREKNEIYAIVLNSLIFSYLVSN